AERDDGLLLTLAMSDRRMRLEVGYGLEAAITDAEAQVILDGMRDGLRGGATAYAISMAIERVGRELPALDPSWLDGGFLERPEPGALAGARPTLTALLCVLIFLRVRPRESRKARGLAAFGGATLGLGALIAWLAADLGGLALREAIAFLGSAAALLALGWPIDVKARRRPSALERRSVFVSS